MDLNYWNDYYKSHRHNAKNSLFSAFVCENYLKPHAHKSHIRLLELGCGNGRDSVYFAKSGIATTAIDQVGSEIDYLNANFGSESCAFVCGDFSDLNALKSLQAPYDCVYSRFSLHSITYTQQTRLFSQIPHYLAFGGILAIETRGHKNALYQKGERVSGEEDAYIYQSHYRRFVALEDLLADIRTMSRESNTESKTTQNQSPSTKLKPSTFEILYAQESRGFAPFTQGDITEDDYFIRVIARLKSPLGGGANRYIIILYFFPKSPSTSHLSIHTRTVCANTYIAIHKEVA